MIRRTLRLYLINLLLVSGVGYAASSSGGNCPDGTPGTTVFFVNGIWTDSTSAESSLVTLEQQVRSYLKNGSLRASECLVFKLAPNPTAGVVADLWVAVKQSLGNDVSRLWRILSGSETAPLAVQNALTSIDWSHTDQTIRDKDVALYEDAIKGGNKAIAVAHSQGNFYANESYFELIGHGHILPDPNIFSIVNVATPTPETEGGAPYTTLCSDFIWRVPLALTWNISNNIFTCNAVFPGHDKASVWPLVFDHGFVGSYLSEGSASQSKILADIEAAIPVRAPTYGNLVIRATLNGQPWPASGSAPLEYLVTGPQAVTLGQFVPRADSAVRSGSYVLREDSIQGGPPGASLVSITPSDMQFIGSGKTITFTINFSSVTLPVITQGELDGTPWSGNASYGIVCPFRSIIGLAIPENTANGLAGSTCTITYNSGGPADSMFLGISPCLITSPPSNTCSQTIAGQSLIYTMKFRSNPPTAGFKMSSGSQSAFDGNTLDLNASTGTVDEYVPPNSGHTLDPP